MLFPVPVGTNGPRLYFFELLPGSCSSRSLDWPFNPRASEHRTRTLPGSSPGRSTEVTRTFTTPEFLCSGNRRPGHFLSAALPLSYSDFRRWWESNPRPSALSKYPVPSPRCKLSDLFLSSLFHCLVISLPGTPVSSAHNSASARQISALPNPGRNQRSRSFGLRTRRPISLSNQEVTVNFTIPECHSAKKLSRQRIYAGPAARNV